MAADGLEVNIQLSKQMKGKDAQRQRNNGRENKKYYYMSDKKDTNKLN